jgi:hypothetical protein
MCRLPKAFFLSLAIAFAAQSLYVSFCACIASRHVSDDAKPLAACSKTACPACGQRQEARQSMADCCGCGAACRCIGKCDAASALPLAPPPPTSSSELFLSILQAHCPVPAVTFDDSPAWDVGHFGTLPSAAQRCTILCRWLC